MSRDLPGPTHAVHWLAFGFGSGLAPKAPGTAGSALALLLFYPLSVAGWPAYAAIVVISMSVGIWLCGRTARDLGVHDHPGIVWDEFVGLWLTLFLAPSGIWWPLAGFLLFRLLDILKPWPIKWADGRVGGGLGIMLDDVIAGIMAALCLQAVAVLV